MRAFAFVVLLGGGVAVAQAPPKAGDYGGVAPGTAPREKHKTKRGPGYVTWVGFQRLGEAPRVFVRVTSSVTPTQAAGSDEVVVTLPGFKLDTENNGRPLDTRWFGTRVTRVRLLSCRVSTCIGGPRSGDAAPSPIGHLHVQPTPLT